MKKTKLLMILSVFALAGCSTLAPVGYETGVVTNPTQKQDIKKLYNDSLDTTEDLEDFTEETSEETSGEQVEGEVQNPSEEIVSSEPTGDVVTSEPVEGEEVSEDVTEEVEEEIAPSITSYHVDYTIDYAMQASLAGYTFVDTSEKQTYSLTYVNTDGEIFMELDLTHEYTDSSFYGEYTGSQKINVVYQDETLYVTQEITNSYFQDTYVSKTSHNIYRRHIHKEYSDYFFLMSVNAMLDPTSRENNDSLIEELLTNETVEIVDVTDNLVKVQFDYEDGVATMVFDTTLNAFVSITFDKSKEKEALVLEDTTAEENTEETVVEEIVSEEFTSEENISEPTIEEIPEEDEFLPEDEFGPRPEDEFEGEEHKDDKAITIDSYRYLINMNFSYNNQIADRLTEEEIAEYHYMGKDYGHHNAYDGYKDDYDYGYHGGRDEKHGNHGDRHW